MFNHLCHCTENKCNSQEKELSIIIFHMNLTHLPAQGGPKTNKINYHNFIFTKHAEKTRHIQTGIRNSSQKGFLEERYIVLLECKYINIKSKKFEVK